MRPSDEYLIRGFPIFRGVSDATYERVRAHATLLELGPGQVVLRQGESPQFLYMLLQGLVETFATHRDKEASLSFIRPPAAFIVAAVWMDHVQLKSVRTIHPSRLLAIPAAVVREVIGQDAAFASAVGLELAIRYRDLVKELKSQRMRSATERLANWLLNESIVSRSPTFELEVTKSLLAARLGMTVEHLSRAFTQLREQGVQVTGSRVEIDPDRLRAFAFPDPLMDGADI